MKQQSKHRNKGSHQITRADKLKMSYKDKSNTINKMKELTYLSIITLNISGLNAPKTQNNWMNTKRPIYKLFIKDPLDMKTQYRMKEWGRKKISQEKRNKKKAKVAIFVANKVDFKTKGIGRDYKA